MEEVIQLVSKNCTNCIDDHKVEFIDHLKPDKALFEEYCTEKDREFKIGFINGYYKVYTDFIAYKTDKTNKGIKLYYIENLKKQGIDPRDFEDRIKAVSSKDYGNYYTDLYIGFSPFRGEGVFSKKKFVKGDIIEFAPFIEDEFTSKDHIIFFASHINKEKNLNILGYGSKYNTSKDPNADLYNWNNVVVFYCIKDIEPNEEITIDYHKE